MQILTTSLVGLLLASPGNHHGRGPIWGLERVIGWNHDESIAILSTAPRRLSETQLWQLDVRKGSRAERIDAATWSPAHPVAAGKKPANLEDLPDLAKQDDREAAWVKKQGLTPGTPSSRTSPDKKASVELTISSVAGKSQGWRNDTWYPATKIEAHGAINREGKTMPGPQFPSAPNELAAYWSPSGRRVVWVTDDGYYYVTPAGGPRIQVLANAATATTLAAKAVPALERAGFAPVSIGPAQDARKASVVYASKEFDSEAKKVAAAVPGGATVQPLGWKTPYDLVVALGDSAGGAP